MNEIIGLYPLQGNGGIASWTKKFLKTFPDSDFTIHPVDIAPDKDFTLYHGLDRFYYGYKAYLRSMKELKKSIATWPKAKIMHTTTSGGGGVFRDNTAVKTCHKNGIKCVMHCRFGSIKELYESRSIVGRGFRENIRLFDEIWVLDSRSHSFLEAIDGIKGKVFLTPNSIAVPDECNLSPKQYTKIGFVGNVLPTKGIVELVEAVKVLDNKVSLSIAGPGSDEMINKLRNSAGDMWDSTIRYYGKLPNDEAVKLIAGLDIIALPTYYEGEAFPISIIEAMSRGKLVISCPRAAIVDMLTDLNGNSCGILVEPKSSQSLKDGILWVMEHKDACDRMCVKAYDKVKTCYDTSVVYELYRGLFKKLTNGTV